MITSAEAYETVAVQYYTRTPIHFVACTKFTSLFFCLSPILKFSLGKVQNGLKQLYALMSEADVISVAHTTMGQMEDPPATKALGISKILKWEESAEASGVINSPHPLHFSLTRRHWWGAADSISVLSSR